MFPKRIQVTSATFGALLVPFHSVTFLPIESLGVRVTPINWLGLVLCATSAVMYFKAILPLGLAFGPSWLLRLRQARKNGEGAWHEG